MSDRTVFRTCPLCEATCGLEIETRDEAVKRIRGDRNDVFSKGFIYPKGSTLKAMFSASTVDQMPRHVASGHLYGSGGLMPVPDLNSNLLTDPLAIDPLSGTSVLNGIPVDVVPA